MTENEEKATVGESPEEKVQQAVQSTGESGGPNGGKKAPEIVSAVMHKVRKGASMAYGTGSTLVREAYHAASEQADRYKHKNEIRKLKARREDASARLGSIIYSKIIIDETPPKETLADREIIMLLQQIQNLDNDVEKIGKELERD